MLKVLVVEDDDKIRDIIIKQLEKWNLQGLEVDDLERVLDSFLEHQPHLVLLDINLPYYDGFFWCQRIREVSKVPIIFITSRDSNMDLIMAMNLGGDDFIQKPFSLDVLMAKIKAMLRRTYSYADFESDALQYKDVVLNLKDNTIIYKDNRLELSKNEFRIIYLLLKNGGEIVDRDHIIKALWEDDDFIDDNTLTVNINRLRKKLKEINLTDYIQTKRGQGYIIQ